MHTNYNKLEFQSKKDISKKINNDFKISKKDIIRIKSGRLIIAK